MAKKQKFDELQIDVEEVVEVQGEVLTTEAPDEVQDTTPIHYQTAYEGEVPVPVGSNTAGCACPSDITRNPATEPAVEVPEEN